MWEFKWKSRNVKCNHKLINETEIPILTKGQCYSEPSLSNLCISFAWFPSCLANGVLPLLVCVDQLELLSG